MISRSFERVGAQNCVVAGQGAFRYSLMSPPQRAVLTTWRCPGEWREGTSPLPCVLAAKPAPHGTGYSIDYAADYAADDRRIEPFLESWLQMHASITDTRTPPKRAHATNSASHRG